MYGKYTVTGTQPIDQRHYLISATQTDTREQALFHQLQPPSHLPLLSHPQQLQIIISESENQNVIYETKEGFEVYQEHNIVQIRLRKGVVPLNEIRSLKFQELMKVVESLILDIAMSWKQISSGWDSRGGQGRNLSNCCTYYMKMIDGGLNSIMPFFSHGDNQVHYYDLSFEGKLSHKDPVCQNRFNSKQVFNNQQKVFKRFIVWLALLFCSTSLVNFTQESQNYTPEILIQKIQSIKANFQSSGFHKLFSLLQRCINQSEEYSLNIFKKQCDLILEKHLKASSHQTRNNQSQYTIAADDKKQSSKVIYWDRKNKQSRSFIDPKNRPEKIDHKRNIRYSTDKTAKKQSEGRLKYSKSLINLSRSAEKGGRKLKKPSMDLFKASKLTNSSTSSFLKQPKIKGTDTYLGFFSSATSNWFNGSQCSEFKMRNFKKGNINISVLNSPQKVNEKQSVEKVGREELDRFSKIQHRSKTKGVIEINTQTQYKKPIEITETDSNNNSSSKLLQDQFTMTDCLGESERKKSSKVHQQITSTFNVSFFQKASKEFKSIQQNHQYSHMKKKSNQFRQKQSNNQYGQLQKKSNKLRQKQNQIIQPLIQSEPQKKVSKQTPKTKSKQFANIESSKDYNSKNTNTIETVKQSQKQLKNINKKTSFLSESQKALYLKHFEMVLRFCNQNKNYITLLPNSGNITFLINFLYYKTLLEHSPNQNQSIYKKLVDLIAKKQIKFTLDQKKQFLMFQTNCDSLWSQSKLLRNLEYNIAHNIQGFSSGDQQVNCEEELNTFLRLSEEGVKLLEIEINNFYKYLKANKAMLINNKGFEILLQFGFMLIVTSIICHQRKNYYLFIQDYQFQKLQTTFNFSFQTQDQHIKQYRSKLSEKDLAYLNCDEELSSLQAWEQLYR